MRAGLAVVAVAIGCGGGQKGRVIEDPIGIPNMSEEKRDAAVAAVLAASARHDAPALEGLLADELAYGGLWFSNLECAEMLSITGTIKGDARAKLAGCLAPLTFAKSERTHPLSNAAVLTYEQGIEIEVLFDLETSKVRWIGYAGQRSDADAVPTVSQVAIEAMRDPASVTALLATDLEALEEKEAWRKRGPDSRTPFYAWFRMCLDSAGAITTVRAYQATSVVARDVFEKHVRGWRFTPVLLDGRPTAVCAMVQLRHPASTSPQGFPQPVPAAFADALVVPNFAVPKRISGVTGIRPPPEEMTEIGRKGGGRIGVFIHYCLLDDGTVGWVLLERSSGYPGFDGTATRMVSMWRFEPPPFRLCTQAVFIYRQR